MKKLFVPLLLIVGLLACNNHKPRENKNYNNPVEADKYHPEAANEKIELNNGAKWKADSTTNHNVDNLKRILAKFDNGSDRSLPAYKTAQSDLQQGMEKMIVECKMEGSNHLALHKWLEPLADQVAALKQASTAPAAAESLKIIRAQMKLYSQYFEL
jgi:hypothetical protein